MSNHKTALMLIKAMTGQANILTIPRVYVDFAGSLEAGLFLSQLLYWSDKGSDPAGWFYKSYEEWEEEICVKEKVIRRAANKFHEMGFLETMLKKDPSGTPKLHYRINVDLFTELLTQFLEVRLRRLAESTPPIGKVDSADSPSSPLVQRLHAETTNIDTNLHLVDSLGMVPRGPKENLEIDETPSLAAEDFAAAVAEGPLIEQIQPVRNVPIDDEGNPLNPEGYDRRDPLFLEIMRHMRGTPGNLESKSRLMWMYLYRRAAEDPAFLEWMQVDARLNHGRWHFPGFYDRMRNERLFERYKRDGIVATEDDLQRLLENDRMRLLGQQTVTIRPPAYDPERFREEQQAQWTNDPSLQHLRLKPDELGEEED